MSECEDGCISNDQLNLIGEYVANRISLSSQYKIRPFACSEIESAAKWIKSYESVATALNWSEESKFRKFRAYLTGPAADWYDVCVESREEQPKSYEELRKMFLEEFHHEDEILMRIKERKQLSHESVQTYIYSKVQMCQQLDNKMSDAEILRCVYEGMNPEIKREARIFNPSSYTELLAIAKRIETAKREQQEIAESISVKEPVKDKREELIEQVLRSVNAMMRKLAANERPVPTQNNHQFQNAVSDLTRGDRRNAPRNLNGSPRCFLCNRVGHIARFCRFNVPQEPQRNYNSNVNNNQQIKAIKPPPDQNAFVSETNKNNRLIRLNVIVEGEPICGMVDSGSTLTIITKELALKLQKDIRKWNRPPARAINGKLLKTNGFVNLMISVKTSENESRAVFIDAMVVENMTCELVLGLDFLGMMKAKIDVASKTVSFDSQKRQERDRKQNSLKGNKMQIKKGVEIPSLSKASIRATVSNNKTPQNFACLVAPHEDIVSKTKVTITENRATVMNGETDLKVFNADKEPVYLKGGSFIANYYNEQLEHEKELALCCAVIEDDFAEQSKEKQHKGENNASFEQKFHQNQSEKENEEKENQHKVEKMPLSTGEVNIGKGLTECQKQELKNVLNSHLDRFAFDPRSLGRTTVCKHEIDTGNSPPFNIAPYRAPFAQRQEIQRQINEMMALGVIRKSNSPYSSPVILVRKKDGSFRFCIDFRRLNADTVKDVPLPNIDDALHSLTGAKVFATLDLNSGFWQIEIAEEHKCKTAFITTEGLYECNTMPFGLKNAPSRFQRLMDSVLSDLKWRICIPYIDDVLIFGKNFEELLYNLDLVLCRFRNANLTLKPSKCVFFVNTVRYLGYVISDSGISPDPEKVKAVQEFPRPKDINNVRQFIGLASYYRKFIKNFSKTAEPLTRLTKKNENFYWSQEQEKAFEELKNKLSSAPVLAHFDPALEIEVRCDGSGVGLGAVLLQKHQDGMKTIAYASRMLTTHEKNYPVSEIEALAVVFALEKFRMYLLRRKFKVYTDHCSLCWLMKKMKLAPRLAKWALCLQDFDFEVVYKNGKIHKDADCLSRNPVDEAREEKDVADHFALLTIEEEPFEFNIKEKQRDDEKLNLIIFALENFEHLKSRDRKKIEKEPITPTEVTLGSQSSGVNESEGYVGVLAQHLNKIRDIAKQNLEAAQLRNKSYYDKKHRDVNFEVGEKVLVYFPIRRKGKSEKLFHKWLGPYRITQRHTPLVYEVETIDSRKKRETVHVSRMKKFYERKELTSSENDCTSDEDQIRINSSSTLMSHTEEQSEITTESSEQIEDQNKLSCSRPSELHEMQESDGSHTGRFSSHPPTPDSDILSENSEGAALRRSTRTRRCPQRFSPVFALFVLCLCTGYALCSFHRVSPIIWNERKAFVVKGMKSVFMNIRYENPCHLLMNPDFVQEENRKEFLAQELMSWCGNSYMNDFVKPMRKLCSRSTPNIEETVLSRTKRGALMIGAIGAIVIGIVSSIGVGSLAITRDITTRTRVENIETIQNELIDKAEALAHNEEFVKKALNTMQQSINEISSTLKDLSKDYALLKRELPRTLQIVSHLTANFIMTKSVMIEATRKWKNKQFDSHLLDLFNITMPCGEECPLELFEPKSCILNENKRLVTITFDAKIVEPTAHVLRADPFTLVGFENETNFCRIEYKGPKEVVYDEALDCITLLKTNMYDTDSDLILKPSKSSCREKIHPDLLPKYWAQPTCEELSSIKQENFIQVKASHGNNFIYCPTHNISVFGSIHECPNFVFELTSNTSFSISKFTYNATQMKIHSNVKFVPEWSMRVNMQLMPRIHELNIQRAIRKSKDFIDSIETLTPIEKPALKFQHETIAFILFGVILFLGFAIIILIVWRRGNRITRSRSFSFKAIPISEQRLPTTVPRSYRYYNKEPEEEELPMNEEPRKNKKKSKKAHLLRLRQQYD
ncbi:retrovirus-related Pol polyprotein from transposon 297-like protein [Dinothrombium tinctorium]|uniref:RNA-directed DNA polymerase n=1 Tax=Dinothrombium tinctorium TaxID=1965070 RepID=A0A443QJP6_9ACAR|nr:retrovirus-related Pol polyprotein from transposon 297-like protein [Dinothrombium tinctorium]